jgi:hypothetical protein
MLKFSVRGLEEYFTTTKPFILHYIKLFISQFTNKHKEGDHDNNSNKWSIYSPEESILVATRSKALVCCC